MLNHVLRYEPVVDLVRRSGAGTLLEVGSGSRGIGRYLTTSVAVTACDVAFDDYGSDAPGAGGAARRVTASVLDLPFGDATFDCVVALDLLEHLPAGDRERAVGELRRVGRDTVIVGCPTGASALRADRRLAGYVRRLRRPRPPWLQEHLVNGFPETEELGAWMGPEAALIANEHTATHAVICALEATPGLHRLPRIVSDLLSPRLGSPVVRRLVRILRAGDRAPAYRTIVVLSRAQGPV